MHTILIVEDDGLVALGLIDFVENDTGHRAVAVTSVAHALRAVEDVVAFALLDINVVDGTTYGFARELQARGIPFAFTSGVNPRDLPADLRTVPLLPKPCNLTLVAAAIQKGLSAPHHQLA